MHMSISKPVKLIYSDVLGPTPLLSTSGVSYYISFLDVATKFLWLFHLKLKSDAHHIFILFQATMEHQFHSKLKAL